LSEKGSRSWRIREFLLQPLDKDQAAFLYLGYAGIVLRLDDRIMAFDIANLLGKNEIADLNRLNLVAFTHSHADHYNRARARGVLKDTQAYIIASKQVAENLKGSNSLERLIIAENGKSINVNGFEVAVIEGIHPRPISIYRISTSRFSVFHGGDSGYSPVKDHPAKLAFLPTGFPSPSSSPESALSFALDLSPHTIVAMHGKLAQMSKFKTLVGKELPETTVIIPEKDRTEVFSI
jgi:L-ascorbate metabolism protein UlaG (beta-lactamase superfamily)